MQQVRKDTLPELQGRLLYLQGLAKGHGRLLGNHEAKIGSAGALSTVTGNGKRRGLKPLLHTWPQVVVPVSGARDLTGPDLRGTIMSR
jgi:hypothetical protein